jgi:general secretion pathway protein F
MLTFQYKAMKSDGSVTDGEIQAPDHEAAVALIQNQGHIPIQVREESGRDSPKSGMSRILVRKSNKAFPLIDFTRDLSTLLRSGVSLENAMVMLVDLAEGEAAQDLLTRILDMIRGGRSLSEALAAESGVFDRFYVNMIRAGEEGGALDIVLMRLSDFLLQYDDLKRNVKTALIYPLILVVITLFSLMILMVVVVPQFQVLFEDMGQQLPLATQIVVASGEIVSQGWWLFVLLVAGITYWLKKRLANPRFRLAWDTRLLRLPLVGDLLVKIQVAVFARTLSTLLASGVTLMKSLSIVKDIMTNQFMARRLGEVEDQVREGEYLADSLSRTNAFPRLLQHLVRVGEESGELESSLEQLADIYDREVKVTIQRMLALLEPALIIGMGVIIGGIISSILLAILSINDLAF